MNTQDGVTCNLNARTLQNLDENLKLFLDDGGVMKKAKIFKNVISKYIFDVPLDQVNPNFKFILFFSSTYGESESDNLNVNLTIT